MHRNFGVPLKQVPQEKDPKQVGQVIVVAAALFLAIVTLVFALVQYLFGVNFGFQF